MMDKFNYTVNRSKTNSLKYDMTEKKFGGKDVIPLWLADMDFKAPEFLQEAFLKRVHHGVFGYTKRSDRFSENVVKWLKRRHKWDIEGKWVVYSPSVLGAIVAIINEFTEKGDEILIQPPVFNQFSGMVKRNNRRILENPLLENNQYYSIDFDDLEDKAKRKTCKMMIFCNPHNPVGRVWRKDEIERVNEICLKNDVLLISDEIHFDLVFGDNVHIPAASVEGKYRNNIITCTSQSKSFNLAGLHTSYCIISDDNYRERFAKRLGRLEIETSNVFGLLAANTFYELGDEWLEELKKYLQGNMEYVSSFLEENIPNIKTKVNEGTYLMWLDCREMKLDNSQLEDFFFRNAKLGLSSGHAFGSGGNGFMRMNIACPLSHLVKAMAQLNAAYQEIEVL
jgi:cystathionine beta-lyase